MRLPDTLVRRTAVACLALLSSYCSLFSTTVWRSHVWNGRIEEAVLNAAADRAACRLAGGRVVVRGLSEGSPVHAFSTAPYAVTAIAISADGGHVAWGDASGRLFRWSPGDEPLSVTVEDSAMTGLAMAPDGASLGVASSGTRISFRQFEDLDQTAYRNPGLEQVRMLAVDSSGTDYLAADHGGQLVRVSVDSSTRSYGSLAGIGVRGCVYADAGDVAWLCWDESGSLFFLGDSLEVRAQLELGDSPVTAHFYDREGERLLLGSRDGRLRAVSMVPGELAEDPLGAFGEAVVGIGMRTDGRLVVVTESGRMLAAQGNGFDPFEEPALSGRLLRAHTSLRAGVATVLTDSGPDLLSLADGNRRVEAGESQGIVLDSAIFHGHNGSGPVMLVLDPQSLSLRLEGDGLSQPFSVNDWTPTRIASAPWSPRIALMSSSGEVRILEESATGLMEGFRSDPDPSVIWEDLAFNEDGSGVRRSASAGLPSVIAPDGPFQLEVSEVGVLALKGVDSDPLFLAWPDLVPASGGGMWSGYLGKIRAVNRSWFHQREYGWGYLLPSADTSWFWFPDEGWFAGSPLDGPWLYSDEGGNWVHTLVDRNPTDWIYDFSSAKWRRFGK